jgi:hypothetical protein
MARLHMGCRPGSVSWTCRAFASMNSSPSSLATTQRYLHPNLSSIGEAGDLLSAHLSAPRSPGRHPHLRVV